MRATHGNAFVKFIIEEGNREDVPNMILASKRHNVRNLVISLDMNIHKENLEKYIIPITNFIILAKKARMDVFRGSFIPDEFLGEFI